MPIDPATLFGLKMATCLAVFLLAAGWLRRRIARVQSTSGPPPEGAAPSRALAHYFGGQIQSLDHERRLHRQTIRILARELERLAPAHPEVVAALELLGESSLPPQQAGLP